MELKIRVNNSLIDAMKAQDEKRKRTLRAIKSQFTLLETSGEDVTEEMRVIALQKMVKERQDSFDIYIAQSRFDLADPEMEEIEIIKEFLPKQLSEDDVRAKVKMICISLGATSMKDMGKVMKECKSQIGLQTDGKILAKIIKEELS